MSRWLAAAVALAVAPTSALAQDMPGLDGFRLRGLVVVDAGGSGDRNVTAGISAGYDFSAGGAQFGVEAGSTGQGYVAGRAGALVGTSTLLFAKAGYALTEVEFVDGTGAVIDEERVGGLLLGAGAEVGLSRRFFLAGEYNYTNFELGGERHQLMAGLGLRF